jgi:hypothetical protein
MSKLRDSLYMLHQAGPAKDAPTGQYQPSDEATRLYFMRQALEGMFHVDTPLPEESSLGLILHKDLTNQ